MHIKETLVRKLIREALVTEDVDVTEDLYSSIMAINKDLGGGDEAAHARAYDCEGLFKKRI